MDRKSRIAELTIGSRDPRLDRGGLDRKPAIDNRGVRDSKHRGASMIVRDANDMRSAMLDHAIAVLYVSNQKLH